MVFKNRLKGFSLIEVILTIALMSVTIAIVFPIGLNQLQTNTTEQNLVQLISRMKELQQRALADDTYYGIYFTDSNQYEIFEGPSYEEGEILQVNFYTGNVPLEIDFEDSSNQLVFIEGKLETSTTGTINFGPELSNYTITINDESFIDFTKN